MSFFALDTPLLTSLLIIESDLQESLVRIKQLNMNLLPKACSASLQKKKERCSYDDVGNGTEYIDGH